MYKIIYAAITTFWILDICNLPFMEMFDVAYPINTWVWLLIWLFIPSINNSKYKEN